MTDDKQRPVAPAKPLSKAPQDYPRRLLLAVAGLTPQILTETVYALAVQREPSFVPTEVRLITTEKGAQRAKQKLLHPGDAYFQRLCADYGLSDITFGDEQIHVLKDSQGQPLQDIRSLEDNTRAADEIVEIVRILTQDEEAALHVSIAGGRKTMGFYLGYVLSLYGRRQDRLSHVLVNEPFEGLRDFFYPTRESTPIHDRHGVEHDAKDAEVTLAEIPFVCLRDTLDKELIDVQTTFLALVSGAQPPPLTLELHVANCEVYADGERIDWPKRPSPKSWPPAQFALYWMLADRARSGKHGFHWKVDSDVGELMEYREHVQSEAARKRGKDAFLTGKKTAPYKYMGVNHNPHKCQINRCLTENLGKMRADRYHIVQLENVPGYPPYRRCGLGLPPDAIKILH